jgi:hypothetical protein
MRSSAGNFMGSSQRGKRVNITFRPGFIAMDRRTGGVIALNNITFPWQDG